MAKKNRDNTIMNYISVLFPTDAKKVSAPIKDQSQVPVLFDILSRRNNHHVHLKGSTSDAFNMTFLEMLIPHFAEEHLPKTLRDSYFFHIDMNKLILNTLQPEHLEEDFAAFLQDIANNHKRIIVTLNHISPLLKENDNAIEATLFKILKSIILNEQCRLIIVTQNSNEANKLQNSYLHSFFTPLKLSDPTSSDMLLILKNLRDELENFHQIIIPDETFSYALSVATHYLSGTQSILDKAIQLLDSGAARASSADRTEQSGHNPILTNAILAQIVSSWTHIPLSHLQHNKFKAAEFIQGMQKQIFGQDAAINLIGLILQYARIKLHHKTGPLCSLLFAGPSNVGKTETALALAEHLFGHKGALLKINLDKILRPTSLSEIKISTIGENGHFPTLLDAIQQTPYAVILLENINQAPPGTIDLFQEIFTLGYTTDQHGNKYDFRHAIFIVTTTLGSERIISLMQPQSSSEPSYSGDLMQLILNEHPHETIAHSRHNLSPQELTEEMMPSLETYFSPNLLRHLNVVPFILLDYPSVEKIVRLKLKLLAKQLDSNYGIELSYAPEIIRFLVQEILWRNEMIRPIDKVLEQHLYSCVAHELISRLEDKNRPKRLLLQLNDAGQVLRCEFVSPSDATLYKL